MEAPKKDRAMGTAGCDECEINASVCKSLFFAQSPSYEGPAELRSVWGTLKNDASWNNVVVVGAHGTILRYKGQVDEADDTIDIWETEPTSFKEMVYGVWGEGAKWYAVGERGTIRSRNSNGSWVSEDIEFSLDSEPPDLRGIWGSGADDIYVVGEYGTILRSENGSWVPKILPFQMEETLRSVWGTASNDIYIVGHSGTILHYTGESEAGGGGWIDESPNAAEGNDLYGVWGIDGHVYAVGDKGTILRRNSGEDPATERWQRMDVPTESRVSAIWGTSATDIVAAGHNGTVLHYGGHGWQPIRSSTDDHFKGIWATRVTDNMENTDRTIAITVGTSGSIFRFAYDHEQAASAPTDDVGTGGSPF